MNSVLRSPLATLGGAALVIAALAGCNTLGPGVIHGGRGAYNEAIIATNNEQLLDMIVRNRYREPAGLLNVVSVTANVRIQGSVSSDVGFGPDSNYTGNLVPLSVGAMYEENPTISYVPVQGQEYLRQMLSPMPLDLTIQILKTLGGSPRIYGLLLKEINSAVNPVLGMIPGEPTDDRFARVTETLAALHRANALVWAREPGEQGEFLLILRERRPADAEAIRELLDLLDAAGERTPSGHLAVRIRAGLGWTGEEALDLQTRSVFELLHVAASGVDVPEDHLESGLAPMMPAVSDDGRHIAIRRSQSRPNSALVAVRRHGWWFSIDATDTASKEAFVVLNAIITASLADAAGGRAAAPVLTVPVSR